MLTITGAIPKLLVQFGRNSAMFRIGARTAEEVVAMKLRKCRHCDQDLPPAFTVCPSCELVTRRPHPWLWLLGTTSAVALAALVTRLVVA